MPNVTLTKDEIVALIIAVEERIDHIRHLAEHLPMEDYLNHVFYQRDIDELREVPDKLDYARRRS